jgi:hypothetical protein
MRVPRVRVSALLAEDAVEHERVVVEVELKAAAETSTASRFSLPMRQAAHLASFGPPYCVIASDERIE